MMNRFKKRLGPDPTTTSGSETANVSMSWKPQNGRYTARVRESWTGL